MPQPRPLEERFNEKVDRSGGPDACWPWIGAKTKRTKNGGGGYGHIRVGPRSEGRFLNATHVAWLLEYGELPTQDVCHTCDNPPCCNPKHLFEGSPLDNTRDMQRKGRGAIGERNGQARLSADDVVSIRASREPLEVLAQRFGVSRSVVGSARSGRRWRSVEVLPVVPPSDGPRRGELHPGAKLTDAEVVEIRQRYASGTETQAKLGLAFGVSQTMVGKIVRGRAWQQPSATITSCEPST